MPLTLVEKIATKYAIGLAEGEAAGQGQIVRVQPKHIMTHDNTGAVIPKFLSIFEGTNKPAKIANPSQPVFAIDHDIQNTSPANLEKYAKIERFAEEQGIDFYPAGSGISHQMMIEQGYVVPGSMCVGSDSHSNMYGALSALGTPVVRTDAACLWATGNTWWQVPKVAKCTFTGKLAPGVTGKDVIITLCGTFNNDEVLNHAVEFVGPGIDTLSISERLTISNMTTEWGALAGVFPFDEVLKTFLLDRAETLAKSNRPGTRREGSLGGYTQENIEAWYTEKLTADDDAEYALELTLDLSTVVPHVAGPNEVKTMTSLPEMQTRKLAIQKAYLLSCTNARLDDFLAAAEVIDGKKVANGVEFYIAAASAEVQAKAEANGAWNTLVEAGAVPLPSGCGPCIGLGIGTTNDGEIAISATNRNFKGRMGSKNSEVYLGSPAVVAASAVAGFITAPTDYKTLTTVAKITKPASDVSANASTASGDACAGNILEGFPEKIKGRVLYLPKDNMNTDGIYAGKWTYKDDMTPDEMKAVTFENYDENFNKLFREGDIIVSGKNFGTGSSREQAATALMFKGVPCVIAGSFSETYRRNAFNNGFLCLECPGLSEHFGNLYNCDCGYLTVECPEIEINFKTSYITLGDVRFSFPQLSTVAQELVVAGGAEALARKLV